MVDDVSLEMETSPIPSQSAGNLVTSPVIGNQEQCIAGPSTVIDTPSFDHVFVPDTSCKCCTWFWT